MEKIGTTINITTKIIIPKQGELPAIKSNKEEILETLEAITDKDIGGIGNEIMYSKIKRNLDYAKNNHIEFADITKEDIIFLIDRGDFLTIKKYIAYIDEQFHCDIALEMIKSGQSDKAYDIFSNLKRSGLNKEIAVALYEASSKYLPLRVFKQSDRKQIVLYYLEQGIGGSQLTNSIMDLEGIDCDKEFANKILSSNNKSKHKPTIICNNIEKFPPEDHKEIALKIINTGGASTFIKYMNKFTGNDKEVAFALGEQKIFPDNSLEYFVDSDKKEILLYWIQHGFKPSLQGISDLDMDFANKLIEKKELEYLFNNIQYFLSEDRKMIFMNSLGKGGIITAKGLSRAIGSIDKKNKEFIMDLFKLIKNPEVLNVIARYVANRPEEFTGLDDQIATLLIDMGFGHEVKENRYYYTNLRTATKRRIFMK